MHEDGDNGAMRARCSARTHSFNTHTVATRAQYIAQKMVTYWMPIVLLVNLKKICWCKQASWRISSERFNSIFFLFLLLLRIMTSENAANRSRITTNAAETLFIRLGHGRRHECNRLFVSQLIPFNPRVLLLRHLLLLLLFLPLFFCSYSFDILMQLTIVACEWLQRTDD